MTSTDFEKFSALMLGEFERVHERFDLIDLRFERVDAQLAELRREMKSVRDELDDLREKVDNMIGYRKEIDHALERIAALERKFEKQFEKLG